VIIPCIDLQNGKVVQLIQGREKALEGAPPLEMLARFSAFPEIQVIDLDAAMGKGENNAIVETLTKKAQCRVGGGVRTPDRALTLRACGADKIIVGTSAFTAAGVNHNLLATIAAAVTPERIMIAIDTKGGRITVKGWTESFNLAAEDVIAELEPYCGGYLATYVDKEGMMQGTDLEWFARLRAATPKPITAAGGITTLDDIRALTAMNIDCALGMAIYTGKLDLAELATLNAK